MPLSTIFVTKVGHLKTDTLEVTLEKVTAFPYYEPDVIITCKIFFNQRELLRNKAAMFHEVKLCDVEHKNHDTLDRAKTTGCNDAAK